MVSRDLFDKYVRTGVYSPTGFAVTPTINESLGRTQQPPVQTTQVPQSVDRSGLEGAVTGFGRFLADTGRTIADVTAPVWSGEEFINIITPGEGGTAIRSALEDVPTIGGFLGAAFDIGASPLTYIPAFGQVGAAGRIGATVAKAGLAGRVGTGVAKAALGPVVTRPTASTALGRAGQVIAGETALQAGGRGAAELAEGTPAALPLALLGGVAGLRGAQKVSPRMFGSAGAEMANLGTRAIPRQSDIVDPSIMKTKYEDVEYGDAEDLFKATDVDDILPTSGFNFKSFINYFKGDRSLVSNLDKEVQNLNVRADAEIRQIERTLKDKIFVGDDGREYVKLGLIDDLDGPITTHELAEQLARPGQPGYRFASRLDGGNVDDELVDALNELENVRIKYGVDELRGHNMFGDEASGYIGDVRETPLPSGHHYVPRTVVVDEINDEFILHGINKKLRQPLDKDRSYATASEGVEGGTVYGGLADSYRAYVANTGQQIRSKEILRSLQDISVSEGGRGLDNNSIRYVDAGLKDEFKDVQFGQDVAKRIESFLEKDKSTKDLNAIRRFSQHVNSFITPLRSTLDVSGIFVTNGIVAMNDPVRFGRNVVASLGDLFSEKQFNDFLRSDRAGAAAPYVTLLQPGVGRTSRYTDYTFGLRGGLGKLTRPFDRAFAGLGNRNRVDLFHATSDILGEGMRSDAVRAGASVAGKSPKDYLTDDGLRQIGRAMDRITGIGTGRAGDFERNVLFASNFYRSIFETLGQLVNTNSIEGALAREYMRNFVSNGIIGVAAVAVAQGRDLEEVLNPLDPRALKKGELRVNSNFGSIRSGGRDISIFGPYDSMARLLVTTGNVGLQFGTEGDTEAAQEFLTFAARSKGSPTVSILTNLIENETFSGHKIFGGLDEESLKETGLAVATSTVPFSLSSALEEAELRGGLRSGANEFVFSAAGLKQRPTTPYEKLDILSQKLLKKSYWDLTPQEKQEFRLQNPEIERLIEIGKERSNTPEAQLYRFRELDKKDRFAEESGEYERLRAGEINPAQFREIIQNIQSKYSTRANLERERLGIEYVDEEPGTPMSVLRVYYDDVVDANKSPSGEILWDSYEKSLANLHQRIDNGEFGDADRAREFLEERSLYEVSPDIQWFQDNQDIIREVQYEGANYWDQLDRAFDLYKQRVSNVSGRNIETYNSMISELNEAIRTENFALSSRLDRLNGQILKLKNKYQKVMMAKNPELEVALKENGYR